LSASVDCNVTIVGAGPYGLSIAAHLRDAVLPFELLGSPLESWRDFMPRGMLLKSERFASNLWDPQRRFTLQRYCAAHGHPWQAVGQPLSLASFLNYAEWFRTENRLVSRTAKLQCLRRAPGGFALELADGTRFTSRRVVLATGHLSFRVLPAALAGLPEQLVVHSSGVREPSAYKGRDVCVIGAGQSALETAALLHEHGATVRLVVRRDHIAWNSRSKRRSLLQRVLTPDAGIASGWKSWAISELPGTFRRCFPPAKRHWFVARAFGPGGSWWLRERIEGRVPIEFATHIDCATQSGTGVRLKVRDAAAMRTLDTEHVVAATGYQVDIDRLDYLEKSLQQTIAREARGIPALNASFETSVPGLFMVGLASAPVFGPIMRFMYGAKHVGPVLARRLRSAA
jgi:FAD-dependent urate hydroxylase